TFYQTLRQALAQTAQRAGCSGHVTPHQLRHSFATEMLQLGVSLPALMKLLGHSAGIARALAIPANNRAGTIQAVEHVVFFMQENRAFDHYFGTLRGVRGFGDPRAVKLPSGKSVFHQPDPNNPDGFLLPFHPDTPNFGLKFLVDTPHDWNGT